MPGEQIHRVCNSYTREDHTEVKNNNVQLHVTDQVNVNNADKQKSMQGTHFG